jgi:hypothetical protein
MSLFLTQLNARVAESKDPAALVEDLAHGAMYAARAGDFDSIRHLVAWFREKYGASNARVSAWVMCLEGMTLFCESLSPDAQDRFWRALSLARATQQWDLVALSAAWLAHLAFNRSDYEEMGKYLKECWPRLDHAPSYTRARAFATLACAATYVGDVPRGRKFFELSRVEAVKTADETALSTILYNKASLTLTHLRISLALGQDATASAEFLEMELASSENFHRVLGHSSLEQLFDVVRARLYMFRRKYFDALPLLEKLVVAPKPIGLRDGIGLLALEYAFCLLKTGKGSVASTQYEALRPAEGGDLTEDEKLVYFQLCKELECELLGAATPSTVERLEKHKALYRQEVSCIERWLAQIDPVEP